MSGRPFAFATGCIVAAEAVLASANPGWTPGMPLVAELVAWLGVGMVLRRLPPGWRGSAAWPAVLVLAASWARALDTGALSLLGWAPPSLFGLVGVVAVSVVVVRVLEDVCGAAPRALGLVGIGAVVVARATGLVAAEAGLAPLGRELTTVAAPMGLLVFGVLVYGRGPRGLAAVGVLGGAVAMATVQRASGRGHDGPPVVLITVDTLRWDDARAMTSVARLAERGAYWQRAAATASWTLPSMASIHTGLYPREHGASVRPGPRPVPIEATVPTLAERLGQAGYTTGCFTTNNFTAWSLGFGRGCGTWFHEAESLPSSLTWAGPVGDSQPVDVALRWLPRAPERGAFLWVHLVEPHLPYEELPTDPDDPLYRALDGRFDLLKVSAVRSGMVRLDGPARASLREAYRRDVALADARVGELLDAVWARWDDPIVVLTADHGEEFWDHGGFEHGHSHHGEVVDVPLLVAGGGVPIGPRTDLASGVDIVPTVLARVGLDGGGLAGRDLALPGAADRVVTADGALYDGPSLSARSLDRRAIVGVGEFDLRADPLEVVPLPAGPLTGSATAAAGTSDRAPVEVGTEGLRALGYVE